MATVKTTKRFNREQLFDLLGGDLADVSTTPQVVGTTTDDDGNEVPIYEGVPLDAEGDKEIIVTVKGDGKTPITQSELEVILDSAEDEDVVQTEREAKENEIETLLSKTNPTPADTMRALKLDRELRP